jgi:hypothetical protein
VWSHPKVMEWLGMLKRAKPHPLSNETVPVAGTAVAQVDVARPSRAVETVTADGDVLQTTPLLAAAVASPPKPSKPVPLSSAKLQFAARQTVHISRLLELLLPGDIVLFSCANTPSALQRRVTNCAYDHVGMVVDAAWRDRLLTVDGDATEAASPAGVSSTSASVSSSSASADSTTYSAQQARQMQSSRALTRFFGRDSCTGAQAQAQATTSTSTTGSSGAASDGTSSSVSTPEAGDKHCDTADAATALGGVLSLSLALSSFTPTHHYSLQLLEATGEGVRAYPLLARLHAYGGDYTNAVAVRRLLLPGEEVLTPGCPVTSGPWIPCGDDCCMYRRQGAVPASTGSAHSVSRTSFMASAVASVSGAGASGTSSHSSVSPASTDQAAAYITHAAAKCPCAAVARRRRAMERRFGYFLSEAAGLPYRLTAAKLLFRKPAHTLAARMLHDSASASTEASTDVTAISPLVAALAGAETAEGHDDPNGDAPLVSALPAASNYYCSELLAAAYMRAGLLPAPGSALSSGPPAKSSSPATATGGASSPGFGARKSVSVASSSRGSRSSGSASDPAAYWPNAWTTSTELGPRSRGGDADSVRGGRSVVDALLPPGVRLSAEIMVDSKTLPLQHAVSSTNPNV